MLRMAKYLIVWSNFWNNPLSIEEMAAEDKYFYIYLLTNSYTTQTGIYPITMKLIAFELGFKVERVKKLMDRFIHHYKLIRYNTETKELAVKEWGLNLHKGGKPVMDCIQSELKRVKDTSLIRYTAESIKRGPLRSLYESYFEEEIGIDLNDQHTYSEPEAESLEAKPSITQTLNQQTEKGNINQEQAVHTYQEKIPESDHPITPQNEEDVKEIMEFWDNNGFGFSNLNAKEQLLAWLDDSSFLEPKEVIIKAMKIACASNKRKLNYVVGILKNWENEALLTAQEIDDYQENQKPVQNHKQSSIPPSSGRHIPSGFVLDLTAGEDR